MNLRAISVLALLLAACMNASAASQRIAVLTPDGSPSSIRYARGLERSLDAKFRVVDPDLAAAAYASLRIENPFNQTIETARNVGTVIGCDHFLLVKADVARRSSSARPMYFEASAILFLVNARSGRLEKFLLAAKQSETAAEAERVLAGDSEAMGASVALLLAEEQPPNDTAYEKFDPESKTMRPAMPYRRIKPEYTDTAFLHDIKATVDAEVSVDEKGDVQKIDIVRWAGFGLDEAVIDAVKKMNWRPGERGGKPLPMRILLRYNFTKIEKD